MQQELQPSKAALKILSQSQSLIRPNLTNSRPRKYLQPSKAEVSVKSSRLSECLNVKISDARCRELVTEGMGDSQILRNLLIIEQLGHRENLK